MMESLKKQDSGGVMNMIDIPIDDPSSLRVKLKSIYRNIVGAHNEGKAISLKQDEITNADLVQLYRYAKRDGNRLHSTNKNGEYILWMD